MLNNIEAVIFDLDGTLVDSMWMWREIDESTLVILILKFQVIYNKLWRE